MSSTVIADQTLLEGLLHHDTRQIKILYDRHLPGIIKFIRRNSGTEADARDVFQEALIAVYTKLQNDSLNLTASLHTYLLVVCRNIWFSRLRRSRRTDQHAPEEMAEMPGAGDLGIDWEQQARNRVYFRGYDKLGEKCRRILSSYFDRIPVRQIAKMLNTSESFIKKKKYECKRKLIRIIHEDPEFKELQTN